MDMLRCVAESEAEESCRTMFRSEVVVVVVEDGVVEEEQSCGFRNMIRVGVMEEFSTICCW